MRSTKKNTKITDTVAFYIGFVDCHLKNPGNSTHTFVVQFLTLLSVSGSGTTGLPGAMNAWFSSLMSFRPNVMEVWKSQKKKCHMEIVSNPLNCSWWFPLIFPPRFPKSSLRICRILKGFSSYLRIWILPFTVTKSCLHWKQKDCHLQSFTAFRHWKIVVFYLLKFPQWFFS